MTKCLSNKSLFGYVLKRILWDVNERNEMHTSDPAQFKARDPGADVDVDIGGSANICTTSP